MNHTILASSGLFISCCLALTFFTGPWLNWMLPGNIPLGNLVAILAYLSGAWLSRLLAPARGVLAVLSILAVIAALSWFPLGVWLAGNLQLNFIAAPERARWFVQLSLVLAAYILTVLLATLILRGYRRRSVVDSATS
ncbi:hypothetical protein [Bowmanella sp. JS7-9]|uniref:Hydroxylaminobenzene mutase n=1 Tax=Pseudobowmanella zhangzhouensis TaxID=1537679 RepID=A0ABW1XNZ1_9ALTE|nr:hypothetical protein [Bowmanella sp. JS7-9]TBX23779.1 hypothetical protein TK45_06760 [Bowmanella sp. JS7-9]